MIQSTIEAFDHAKGGSFLQSGCQGNPSSCGGPYSREAQGTNKHATMLASRQHIKLVSKIFKTIHIVRARVACQGLKSASL
jgi:hypothetical protein